MSTDSSNPLGDIAVDQNNLYHEETFTDLRVATLQRLTPIKPDGSPDPSRETLYVGQTQTPSPSPAAKSYFPPVGGRDHPASREKFSSERNQVTA